MAVLIDFLEPTELVFQKSAGSVRRTYEPGRTWFFTDTQCRYISHDARVQRQTYKTSTADARIPNFHIDTLKKGECVLLFNGSGGFGDQIITLPIAKILADRGAEVHILCWPGDDKIWWNLEHIRSVTTVPCLWSFVRDFDHHALFELVVNQDDHQKGQLHPVDSM